MSIGRKPQDEALSRLSRAQDAYRQGFEACRSGVGLAAERIGPAAQHTREVAAERTLAARGWSAPRLEHAAHYVEADLAPQVSTFLTDVAQRVEPEPPPQRGRKAMLGMMVAVAALGVAGLMAVRRSNTQELIYESDEQKSDTKAHSS
ncbi:hypothetical protein [Actinomadura hibisca]|uniref:hypothetical protein n=1 Tax=Actinomadura hibisca TaxID=68565 RepID=UPI0012F7D771|nr:hypothetical protein [Actinomadura hibisca]